MVANTPDLVSEAAKSALIGLSRTVWAMPETCYREERSAAAHVAELKRQGFRVTGDIAGIPTAIAGEAGEGGPVIAFLGEYDALSGLSQEADMFVHSPVEEGGNGHGCGHNLLGAGAMLAAVAVRDWLVKTGMPGRVRYYGCPAEEGGSAKAYMVRAGAFADVDIAFCWHPGCFAGVIRGSSLANRRINFTFHGRASHAATSPESGRSALDAVELMNVGANYLREHMPDSARVHYAIIDGGGISPNVVQARAVVQYLIRANTTAEVQELAGRVMKIAEGAALMTETSVSHTVLAGVSNLVYNSVLGDLMQRNLELAGAPDFSEGERAYARKMQETLTEADIVAACSSVGLAEPWRTALAERILPADIPEKDMAGSTDVGDVSWVVPTVQLWGANYAIGTPFHSWQMTAQGKSAAAERGMVHAARAMAATAVDLLEDSSLRAGAVREFRRATGGSGYLCPLPDEAEPPVSLM